MKLAFRDIQPFLNTHDITASAILVYGPDYGLMKERAKILAKKVVADLNDPFNVVTLDPDSINENPSIISDEANALSMMGGKRLVRIQGAGEKLTATLKDYLESPNADAVIICEAGDLSPRSNLRKLFESHKQTVALPCYVEDERNLSTIISTMIKDAGLTIERDALGWLSSSLTGDRGKVRSEIEKLILYIGSSNNNIRLEDAIASVGDSGALSLDNLCYACSGQKAEEAYRAYRALMDDGMASIVILRSLQNHFKRLYYIKQQLNDGEPLPTALSKLQPPLFFKVKDMFQSHLGQWSSKRLMSVLAKLQDIESQTKSNDAISDETLIGQFISGLVVSKKAA